MSNHAPSRTRPSSRRIWGTHRVTLKVPPAALPDVAPDLESFVIEACAWLKAHAAPRQAARPEVGAWGVGSDSVAIFPNISAGDELAMVAAARRWHRLKCDAGYGSITWPTEYGGRGLPRAFEKAFHREEAKFGIPLGRELLAITFDLVAPTILTHGTPEQRERFLPPMLRAEEIWCQLFSEPAAGSDLASLRTRAERDGDVWAITGQKVWTSGAHFSEWGYCVCRTDPTVPKHRGLTAFLVPMDAPGVTVRPLRQMSGGSSFNEVFLDGVAVSDSLRLGAIGEGWKVALTTLGFERSASNGADGGGRPIGGTYHQVLALARRLGRDQDPIVRQRLAELYTLNRLMRLNRERAAAEINAGHPPGPQGSIGKLLWTQNMQRIAAISTQLLGAKLTADSHEWGTYAWTEHVLGAPGYRIAGGTDEVQHNIIAERVLGLPRDPAVDRDLAFNEGMR